MVAALLEVTCRSSKDELISSYACLFKREENSPMGFSQTSPWVPLARVESHTHGLTAGEAGQKEG